MVKKYGKEYNMPENEVNKQGRTVIAYLIIIYILAMALLSSILLARGVDEISITLTVMNILLIYSLLCVFGWRIARKRFKKTSLVLDEDCLFWHSFSSKTFTKVMYSDIEHLDIKKNKRIVLWLKNYDKKILIPKYLKGFENIYMDLQNKLENRERVK